jgi:hypothetical protein
MRFELGVLIFTFFLITPLMGSAEEAIVMNEDSTFQTDLTVNQMLEIRNETMVEIGTYQENVTVKLVNGHLNITTQNNWFGVFTIFYGYMEDNISWDGVWSVNVTPVNDDPEILKITLSGDPGSLENPVSYGVSYSDIDGDPITVKWYLDDEEITSGDQGHRYIYPDQNNLTVVIDDGNGGTDSMTVTIHTIPPEGWGEEPDNTKNRVIFWIIFGTAGIILLAAMVWVLFRPESKVRDDPAKTEEKDVQNLPKNNS